MDAQAMRRELYGVKERIDSAIARLRRFQHPLIEQIIARDLGEARRSLEYIEEAI